MGQSMAKRALCVNNHVDTGCCVFFLKLGRKSSVWPRRVIQTLLEPVVDGWRLGIGVINITGIRRWAYDKGGLVVKAAISGENMQQGEITEGATIVAVQIGP